MQHEPCSLLGDAQSAVNLIAELIPFLQFTSIHTAGSHFSRRNRRILKHGADLERELLLGVISVAAVQAGLRQIGYFVGIAARAADNSIRPAHCNHELAAVFIIAEVLDCFLKCLGCFHAPRL